VYVPRKYHLPCEAEKAEYDKHENSAFDPGYRQFLSRLVAPLKSYIKDGDSGLDFGCGPGPAISSLLADKKVKLCSYDPYYENHASLLQHSYNFVVATEVVEHFCCPGEAWPLMFNCVKPGGVLGIMTKLVINLERFKQWHYKNDPTHVSFYSLATLEWIASRWNVKLTRLSDDAFIFERPTP